MGVHSTRHKKNYQINHHGNSLTTLIAINAIVFLILSFIKIAILMSNGSEEIFVSQVLHWMTISPRAADLLTRPWTIVSFMFTHIGVWELISNMLWLYAFGFILHDFTGNKALAPLYLYGGFVGATCFLGFNFLVPILSKSAPALLPLEGAATALMAIAAATATLAPNFRIFPMLNGGIPVWILTCIFFVLDLTLVAQGGFPVVLAHVAAAGFGFFYMRALSRGSDWGAWMHQLYNKILHLFDPKPGSAKQGPPVKQAVFHQQVKENSGLQEYSERQFAQQRIDDILDKISADGIHSLSEEEKEYLRQASKQ